MRLKHIKPREGRSELLTILSPRSSFRMKVILLVAMMAFAAATPVKEEWTSFKKQHGKSYHSTEEEQLRMAIYLKNQKMIEEHNVKYEAGLSTYYLEMNHLGDMLPEEVNKFGLKASRDMRHSHGFTFLPPANVEIAESIDWRQLGGVSPVQDQGFCGACWAFGSAGSVEGQLFRKTGKLVSLSEQQLIDCSGNYGNQGCGGGFFNYTFNYLENVEGLLSEDSYPFEGKAGTCRYNKKRAVPGTKVKTYVDIEPENDDALKAAVATVGPISIAVSAGSDDFQFYGGGIFDGDSCETSKLNHAILLVGYGSENGVDFWIIKNSWSTEWGEKGYMRLARAKKNACGISSCATYPILE